MYVCTPSALAAILLSIYLITVRRGKGRIGSRLFRVGDLSTRLIFFSFLVLHLSTMDNTCTSYSPFHSSSLPKPLLCPQFSRRQAQQYALGLALASSLHLEEDSPSRAAYLCPSSFAASPLHSSTGLSHLVSSSFALWCLSSDAEASAEEQRAVRGARSLSTSRMQAQIPAISHLRPSSAV